MPYVYYEMPNGKVARREGSGEPAVRLALSANLDPNGEEGAARIKAALGNFLSRASEAEKVISRLNHALLGSLDKAGAIVDGFLSQYHGLEEGALIEMRHQIVDEQSLITATLADQESLQLRWLDQRRDAANALKEKAAHKKSEQTLLEKAEKILTDAAKAAGKAGLKEGMKKRSHHKKNPQ